MTVSIVKSLLTQEERARMYKAGQNATPSDLQSGAILMSRHGRRVRRFDCIKQKQYSRKEYVFFSDGSRTGFWRVRRMYRDVTEVLAAEHPELPDEVFPDWA